jgi:uncharacterized protein
MSPLSDAAHRRATIARISFPKDEARQRWLPLLLKAYAIIDAGVTEAVAAEESKGSRLACRKGCAACCRSHTTIPVYPLELIGITWYTVEKVEGELRGKLTAQFEAHRRGEPCPMLVDEVCAVHPLRPMACRQFNVFGRICAEGEDAYYTRRAEVLTPIKAYADAAFDAMLPFHGIEDEAKRRELIGSGAIHGLVKVLQEYDWNKLAARMRAFDKRQAAAG